MMNTRFLLLLLLGLFFSCNAEKPEIVENGDAEDVVSTVYLLRHAEKDTSTAIENPRDPALSETGKRRAEKLAHILGDAGINRIFSSDYTRTRTTVTPLAQGSGIDIEIYDPRDLEAFATQLKSMNGKIVVSGHSNTTPTLVSLLGGEAGKPIEEKSEYDRLYMLVLKNGKSIHNSLLRYGEPCRN